MDIELAGHDFLIDLAHHTRRVNLYRLHPAADLSASRATKAEDGEFTTVPVRVGQLPGLLVAGMSEDEPVDWTRMIRSLTDVDLGFRSRTAAAALFVRSGADVFAVTFGQGWRLVRDSAIDRQFGLDLAVRMLDPDEIRQVTRWALSARSRVDRNTVPSGQGLWAFGLREHAELVRQLTGYVRPDLGVELTHVRRMRTRRNFRLRLDFGDSVKIPLGADAGGMAADLAEISRILREQPVDARLQPLTWVRRIPPRDDRVGELDQAVADLLTGDSTEGDIGIAYPSRYYEGPDVHRYRGYLNSSTVDTPDLTLDDLARPLARHDDRVAALRTGRIAGYDEDGRDLGGEIPALQWIAAEVEQDGEHRVLMDGEWYELGDEYLRHVERVTERAFRNVPPWTLPAWQNAPMPPGARRPDEDSYNRHVATVDPRFLCLDKKLVHTRAHRRGFEACDLLGPGNELIHVKRTSSRTGSSPLSHLFAQGLVSAESLTDAQAWQKFVALVERQAPDRVATLGSRPSAVVYAIHRADRVLTPGSLFTFARSALVSAWVTLTMYGIPVYVTVIP